MSLFPRFPNSEFAPIFRLLDDYDAHRATGRTAVRSFQPKFDVREVQDAYELHGEIPGIDQKDINIEFTDPHTLIVKGRTEREYTSGNPDHTTGRITEGDEGDHHSYHKATVEDESAPASTEVTSKQPEAPKAKYWISERSVGEFHRSFSFPSRVDQDAVKASLKNGILSVVVPKAKAQQARRINIE